jgi:glycerol-3-phosphate cytidylyltransferase
MRVVYTAGVYDLLHRGHLNALWKAKQLGDVLIVGVIWDSGVMAYKHVVPTENVHVRVRRVERLAFVDVVVQQRTTSPLENIERFRPDVLVHGGPADWERLPEMQEAIARLGIEFHTLPYTPGISSTLLRQSNGHRSTGEADTVPIDVIPMLVRRSMDGA